MIKLSESAEYVPSPAPPTPKPTSPLKFSLDLSASINIDMSTTPPLIPDKYDNTTLNSDYEEPNFPPREPITTNYDQTALQ